MWASAKRESFIREMLCFIEFAKVFTRESFQLYGILCRQTSHSATHLAMGLEVSDIPYHDTNLFQAASGTRL